MLSDMKWKIQRRLCSLCFAGLAATACWSTPNDYWEGIDTSGDSNTESEEPDAGECDENDSTGCPDGGIRQSEQ